jgi:uncharacterized protein YeaO (DUF488 family)
MTGSPNAAADRIRRRRAYDAPGDDDGYRVLVDRLWPRGLSRDAAAIDEWVPGLAPSDALRRWFAHVPERWEEFRRRYREELAGNAGLDPALDHLLELAAERPVTLVFAARDTERNNAVVLQELLQEHLSRGGNRA